MTNRVKQFLSDFERMSPVEQERVRAEIEAELARREQAAPKDQQQEQLDDH